MEKCPVCEIELAEPLPPSCGRCTWVLHNSKIFLHPITANEREEHQRKLEVARSNWNEKVEAIEREKKQEVEQIRIQAKMEKAETSQTTTKYISDIPAGGTSRFHRGAVGVAIFLLVLTVAHLAAKKLQPNHPAFSFFVSGSSPESLDINKPQSMPHQQPSASNTATSNPQILPASDIRGSSTTPAVQDMKKPQSAPQFTVSIHKEEFNVKSLQAAEKGQFDEVKRQSEQDADVNVKTNLFQDKGAEKASVTVTKSTIRSTPQSTASIPTKKENKKPVADDSVVPVNPNDTKFETSTHNKKVLFLLLPCKDSDKCDPQGLGVLSVPGHEVISHKVAGDKGKPGTFWIKTSVGDFFANVNIKSNGYPVFPSEWKQPDGSIHGDATLWVKAMDAPNDLMAKRNKSSDDNSVEKKRFATNDTSSDIPSNRQSNKVGTNVIYYNAAKFVMYSCELEECTPEINSIIKVDGFRTVAALFYNNSMWIKVADGENIAYYKVNINTNSAGYPVFPSTWYQPNGSIIGYASAVYFDETPEEIIPQEVLAKLNKYSGIVRKGELRSEVFELSVSRQLSPKSSTDLDKNTVDKATKELIAKDTLRNELCSNGETRFCGNR